MTLQASEFKQLMFWLDRQKIINFVPWGYEDLPEKLHGGDVDLFVYPAYYFEVREKLLQMGYKTESCPKHSAEHMHEKFIKENFYTLHIFDSFCFTNEGKYFLLNINSNELCSRIRYKKGTDIRIPSPAIEVLFTALRILGGRDDCQVRLNKFVEPLI